MKIGKLDIKKAYYGSKELTTNNAFVGSVPLIDTPDTPPTGWVTFKANQSSTIGLSRLSSYQKLLYSNNKKDWNVFDTSTSISMSAGDEIYIAGILKRNINSSNYTNFSITGDVSISGNIVYLWNYNNSKALLKQYCGFNLFNGCTGITDASELTLGTSDTTLASDCYYGMFYNCTSLTTAPELPATTLADFCYSSMFYGCTSLTKAPELPATTLVDWCYSSMFFDCTSLSYIKCLAKYISAYHYTAGWVSGVASTGTFISNVDSSWPTGINGIPEGWDASQKEFVGLTFTAQQDNSSIGLTKLSTNHTLEYSTNLSGWNTFDTTTNISLNTGDKVYIRGKLNANNTTSNFTQFKMSGKIAASGNINSIWDYENLDAPLKPYCGFGLFSGCTGLIDASELTLGTSDTQLADHCYTLMFRYCTSLTTTPKLPATKLAGHCYVYMFYGCRALTTAPELPATTLAPYCYNQMFQACTSLTAPPSILPATTLAESCYNSMFYNCTSLTTAPTLPSTTLAVQCYSNMFYGCISLTTAPELPATKLAEGCYGSMFKNCTSLIAAPELPATTLANLCYYYMFNGCSNLNCIKCLAVNRVNQNASTTNWVSGVASTGTFVKDTKANWPTGSNGIPEGWTVEQVNYPGLKFEAIEDSEFSWTCNSSSFENKFYYSLDDGLTWTNYTNPIPFSKGTILCLKGDYPEGLSNNSRTVRFALSGKVKASGNIMSLIDNGACNTLTIPCNSCFRELFRDCTSLITPPELPATMLAPYCYNSMFSCCTSLTTAPELHAPILADFCYAYMFYGCSSLTTAPELPATTLADFCYRYMFYGCSSLIYPPTLPATTLAEYCYESMFRGCSSLVYPPALPATTLADYCYYGMFYNCTSLTTAPALPATTLVNGCYRYMFYGCTSLTTASELPATTLADDCYAYMFCGCSSLTTAPELPATTLVNGCYRYMFYGCTSLTTAPELPATTLARFCYYYMFRNCISLNYIKCLATDISATNCTYNWVSMVPSSGTFVKASSASWPTGDSGIPSGWEVIDAK